MDYITHYRRAVKLADAVDHLIGCVDDAETDAERDDLLRRAEVLAHACNTRAQLAWVAYMGVDALAEQQLIEDVRALQPQGAQVTNLRARRRGDDPA